MEALLLALNEPQITCQKSQRVRSSSVDETSDEGREQVAAAATVKNRKTTYYARKDELEELEDQAASLAKRVKTLQAVKQRRQQPLLNTLATNASLQSHLKQNRTLIAGTQSLVASYGIRRADPPIGCYIHLPAGESDRRRTIDGMKQHKIQEALEYLLARSRFADLSSPTRQLENYVTPQGDHVALHWEIAHFDHGVFTVEQVYNETVEFLRTQEMALAEKLGTVSVREGEIDDEQDLTAAHIRVLATHEDTLLVEKNLIQMSKYFTRSDLVAQPHGVFVVDYVDLDDAFPYQPESRIRKDVASAKLIVQSPSSSPQEPPRIALLHWGYINVHNSPLASSDELESMARDGLRQFFETYTKEIRDRLTWRFGASATPSLV